MIRAWTNTGAVYRWRRLIWHVRVFSAQQRRAKATRLNDDVDAAETRLMRELLQEPRRGQPATWYQ